MSAASFFAPHHIGRKDYGVGLRAHRIAGSAGTFYHQQNFYFKEPLLNSFDIAFIDARLNIMRRLHDHIDEDHEITQGYYGFLGWHLAQPDAKMD